VEKGYSFFVCNTHANFLFSVLILCVAATGPETTALAFGEVFK
jgi:hypothetical protein